jgi:hypothetical protein
VAVAVGANAADSFRLMVADSNAHRAKGLELALRMRARRLSG